MRIFLFLVPLLAASGLFVFAACSTTNGAADAGAPCTSNSDCPTKTVCIWPTANACGQPGNCVVPSDPTSCAQGSHVCPCNGGPALIATCDGVAQPVTGDFGCLHAPCATDQDCNAGLTCQVGQCYPPQDGGPSVDAGAQTDSAPSLDSAADAPTDSGPAVDSSTPLDSGPATDSGSPTDSGADGAD